MKTNSSTISIHSKLCKSKSNANISHIHILCPYKFCNCFCTQCNTCSVCSCVCHSSNKKTKVNTLSLSKDNNNSEKTILSNFSSNIYQRTKKYLHCNCENSLSQNNDINHDRLTKKIFYDKLYKNIGNNNGRSLSEINNKRNNESNNIKQCLYRKEKYFNKSYMTNYNSNCDNSYNYNYDNKKYLSYRNPMTERENASYKKYLTKNKDEMETNDNITDRPDENIVNKYLNLNYDKDLESNRNEKTDDNINEKSNYQYLTNYFRKRCKNKSSLNSPHRAKIKEIIIKSKINKNQYTTYELTNSILKNEKLKLIKNKNRKSEINDENKDISNINNKTYEFNKLLYNNYITRKDKINYDKQINRNRNKQNLFNKKNNKTSYVKLNHNLNNIKKQISNNLSKIKKRNYIKESKMDKLNIYSFSFSLINNNNNTNNIIIENLNKEIYAKNQEILEYKNRLIAQQKDVEFYKNEIYKLKQLNNKYFNNMNQEKKKLAYKNIFSEDINYNLNPNYSNNNKKNKLTYKYNNQDRSGLSSKLNLNTNLNIDNPKYYLTFGQNQLLGDKCIFAISSITKLQSILCFDYTTKLFSYIDYADFGDFQNNFLKTCENTNEIQKNKSIYLTVNYNFYIITGENYDLFYVLNAQKRTINKLCSLKNNHSNGALLSYNGNIICLSGNYNKKVELYNEAKNLWTNLPELQVERSGCASVIFKNKYLFCLFGYNLPTKQYLNTIEYLDIEKYNESSWKYLKYKNENLLSLYLNFSFCINYKDEKIIIVGGNNGKENKPNEYFYQLIINKNFPNNKDSYIEKTNRKLKDINKNKNYLFNKGHTIISDKNNLYCMLFDDNLRLHVFNANNMAHDVFYTD